MARSQEADTAGRPHALTMENRSMLSLSGVREVLSFDEKQLALQTEGGKLTVSGSGLHITTLLLEEGRISLEGQVDALVYSDHGSRSRRGLRELLK